jgi:hypothetical protein
MMQVDIENTYNNVSQAIIFRELRDVEGPLANIVAFTMMFYGVHFSLSY